MEVIVKYENGFRFSATCKGYMVTTGRGEDGNKERDGMWPAQLFEASIGMCIGGYIAKFCKEQGIPCEDMTIELSRRIEANSQGTTPSGAKPSRTTRILMSKSCLEQNSPPNSGKAFWRRRTTAT
jgi:hypothetical protein